MYGFEIGDIVTLKVNVFIEPEHKLIHSGTKLRIVAIAPKVYETRLRDEYHDNHKYFYNAVLASQENDWENRIREDFCTIKKESK